MMVSMCKYDGYEMKTLWIYESNDETTFGPVCGRDGANAVECSYWHLWQLPVFSLNATTRWVHSRCRICLML